MHIARAQPSDADALTHIAYAAKRHWGYPEEWLHAWRTQLTLTPDYLRQHATFVAVGDAPDSRPLGFATFELPSATAEARLEHLWVLPAHWGRGVGRALFARIDAAAREAGATSLTITSDPHAEAFYRRMGAVIYGWQPAPMEDAPARRLPLLVKSLATGKS